MNILVVEDDARVAVLLQRGLGAEGYRVQLGPHRTKAWLWRAAATFHCCCST